MTNKHLEIVLKVPDSIDSKVQFLPHFNIYDRPCHVQRLATD